MAVKKGTQNVPIDTLRIDAFSGGMNTSAGLDGRDILDNECPLIENLEFDDLDNLVTRDGIRFTFAATLGFTFNIFSFNTESGFVGIINTPGTSINSYDLFGVQTSITGGLVVPSNVRWYWKSLNNVAVGVNGSTGNGNPIQIVGPAPGTASHLAAAPDGKFIEEWNSRLVIVHVSNPNRIQFSDLGTATVWNTDGLVNPAHGITLDVTPGDGDIITGLFAWRERLFVFKRKRIYVIRATALPVTDPNNWELVEYSKLLGCVNQSTVREIFDDVVFLSEGGLVSLTAAEIVADFSSAVISSKISEIQRIRRDAPETSICAYALSDRSQYWLAVAADSSPTGSDTLWVMDYKQIKKGLRWTVFRGVLPTAIELYNGPPPVTSDLNQNIYLLGITTDNPATSSSITRYQPNTLLNSRIFRDVIASAVINPIISRIHTKTFDFGLDEYRKLLLQWYLRTNVISNKAHFKISYEQDDPLEPVVHDDFDSYGLSYNKEKLFRKAFFHGVSRKVVSVKFFIRVGDDLNQGVSIKNFGIKYGILSERRSESMAITTTLKNISYTIDRNRTVIGNVGGGQDLIYNFLLPFDSLKTDGDFVDVNTGGSFATNDNDKAVFLQIEGDPVTGVGGDIITGAGAVQDFDGAGSRDCWGMRARITRLSATSVVYTAMALIGQFLADGAGAISAGNTNGLTKADSRTYNVANLNLNDLTIQVIGQGVANDDVVHRMTTIELNQQ